MSQQKQNPTVLFSRDAEQSVLGGLMLDNECWDEVALLVSIDDFYYHVHRTIFREMTRLISRGKPIDLITLAESIESQGTNVLDQMGVLRTSPNCPKTPPVLRIFVPTARLCRSTARPGNLPVLVRILPKTCKSPVLISPR